MLKDSVGYIDDRFIPPLARKTIMLQILRSLLSYLLKDKPVHTCLV